MGRQRRHRLRPQPGAGGRAVVELRGADTEPVRFAADLVERHQPGVAVEHAVLDRLGGHRAAQLLQARRGLAAAGQRRGDDLQQGPNSGAAASVSANAVGRIAARPG